MAKYITHVSFKDFLGIKVADFDTAKVNVMVGENAQGKTAMLSAVRAVFEGMPKGAIRESTTKAELLINISDGVTVSRRKTELGEYVDVWGADGKKMAKPQAFLNSMRGPFAYNPIGFMNRPPKEQRKFVLMAMPIKLPPEELDTANPPHDDEHPLEYVLRRSEITASDRREVGRQLRDAQGAVREAEAELEQTPGDASAPTLAAAEAAHQVARDALVRAETIAEGWQREAARLLEQEKQLPGVRAELEKMRARAQEPRKNRATSAVLSHLTSAKAEVEDLRQRLREAEKKQVTLEQEHRAAQDEDAAFERLIEAGKAKAAALDQLEKAVVGERAPPPDTASAAAKLREAEIDIERAAARVRRDAILATIAETKERMAQLEGEVAALDVKVHHLRDVLPKRLIEEQVKDLAGLEITDEGLRWDGRPIENCSGAEQIAISLQIVKLLLPSDLKVICVDGIEALSDERRKRFMEIIEKDDCQYFVTRVGEPQPGELRVKDGTVQPASAPAPATNQG